MSKRQFSFQKYWEDLSGGHVPLLSFSRADDYESWSRDARAKLLELLGPFPERCDLAAEVEYSVDEGDFIRERVVFDSEENMSVPCILLIPKSDHRGRAVISKRKRMMAMFRQSFPFFIPLVLLLFPGSCNMPSAGHHRALDEKGAVQTGSFALLVVHSDIFCFLFPL